jgi:hypothetical protein
MQALWCVCLHSPIFHSNFFKRYLCTCLKHISKHLFILLLILEVWSWSWSWSYCSKPYLSPPKLWVWIPLMRGVLDTTLCDKAWQWLSAGRSNRFSLSTLVSSTNKTDHHDIAEILLKEAFNTITQPPLQIPFKLLAVNLFQTHSQHLFSFLRILDEPSNVFDNIFRLSTLCLQRLQG